MGANSKMACSGDVACDTTAIMGVAEPVQTGTEQEEGTVS